MRLEPKGSAAAIDLDDYRRAIDELVPLAEADFAANRAHIELFFQEKVAPRQRFHTESLATHEAPGPASGST